MSSHRESEFSPEERCALLSLARASILAALTGTSRELPEPGPACFALRRGAFVTVHVYGKLRGCIGLIEGHEPLCQTIVHCAESAAFRDSRFPPLRADELPGLHIEISVLSELFPLTPEQIEIGKHGLLIYSAGRHGLLLPQVAVEHGLSPEQFLAETCRKAGLPREAFRSGEARLFGFTCDVIREESAGAAES
jgi:AmmeMemoRadiSam system protein A